MIAGYSDSANQLLTTGSHFEDIKIELYDYDLYKENTFILGDAIGEVRLADGIWYNNYNSFINDTNNWFIRGGIGTTNNDGIYYYNATTDTNSEYISTRIVIKL